jgi:hypothetical protein
MVGGLGLNLPASCNFSVDHAQTRGYEEQEKEAQRSSEGHTPYRQPCCVDFAQPLRLTAIEDKNGR